MLGSRASPTAPFWGHCSPKSLFLETPEPPGLGTRAGGQSKRASSGQPLPGGTAGARDGRASPSAPFAVVTARTLSPPRCLRGQGEGRDEECHPVGRGAPGCHPPLRGDRQQHFGSEHLPRAGTRCRLTRLAVLGRPPLPLRSPARAWGTEPMTVTSLRPARRRRLGAGRVVVRPAGLQDSRFRNPESQDLGCDVAAWLGAWPPGVTAALSRSGHAPGRPEVQAGLAPAPCHRSPRGHPSSQAVRPPRGGRGSLHCCDLDVMRKRLGPTAWAAPG